MSIETKENPSEYSHLMDLSQELQSEALILALNDTGRRHLPSRSVKSSTLDQQRKELEAKNSKRKPVAEVRPASAYENFNCAVCEGTGMLLSCDGPCRRAFHLHCATRPPPDNFESADPETGESIASEAWYCLDCHSESHKCKLCGETGVDEQEIFRCSIQRCGQFFHKPCLAAMPNAKLSDNTIKCGSHVCDTCGESGAKKSVDLCVCVRCPRSFHPKCVTPGSIRFQGNWLLCDAHEPLPTTNKDDVDLEFEKQSAEPLTIFGSNPLFFPTDATWIPLTRGDFKLPQHVIREGDKFKLSAAIPHFKRVAVNYYNEEFVRRPTYVGEVELCMCGDNDYCEENCFNRASMMECNRKCRHAEKCQNQRISRREHAKTKVVGTPGRGFGLQVTEDVKAGSLMIEYCGEVVSESECNRRLDSYKLTGQKDFYMMKLDSEYVIDANQIANNARFINHSCDPNCKTELWTVGAQRRVGIFAMKDLTAGTELTYDYCCEGYWKAGDEQPCLCGSSNCRKFLGAKAVKKLNEEKPAKKNKRKRKSTKTKPITAADSTAEAGAETDAAGSVARDGEEEDDESGKENIDNFNNPTNSTEISMEMMKVEKLEK